MPITRRNLLGAIASTSLAPNIVRAQDDSDVEGLLGELFHANPVVVSTALRRIEIRGGTDLVSSLIFSMRFSAAPRGITSDVLRTLTGEKHETWFDWMLWQEANPHVISHPAYYAFKRKLLLQIDPNFDDFLDIDAIQPEAMKIRFEEVTWGGVRKDGIPSLDNPKLIAASDATYMRDTDLVFGVAINGDARAYPLRIMGWHEMFNDVIGGVPVALAYCTLCGSGILFETHPKGRQTPYVFGSSGFLYRSNKLMFDRGTNSLWNQFTGKPVSGRLVDRDIELQQRPVVITQWKEWRAANPGTKILSIKTGHKRDYGSGVVYSDYFASDDLMFPASLSSEALNQKDYVFGVRLAGGSKAYPLEAFEGGRVINDAVGFQNLVLIGDAATRSVRAYDRGETRFDAKLSDGTNTWQITEDALIAPDGRKAPRVAGHIAYWFAWVGYLGDSSELFKE